MSPQSSLTPILSPGYQKYVKIYSAPPNGGPGFPVLRTCDGAACPKHIHIIFNVIQCSGMPIFSTLWLVMDKVVYREFLSKNMLTPGPHIWESSLIFVRLGVKNKKTYVIWKLLRFG